MRCIMGDMQVANCALIILVINKELSKHIKKNKRPIKCFE